VKATRIFADCRSYGIKVEAERAPQDIHIYECRCRDIGVRAIKGSAGQHPNIRAVKGSRLKKFAAALGVGRPELGAWEVREN
jgi:hypothetical protein